MISIESSVYVLRPCFVCRLTRLSQYESLNQSDYHPAWPEDLTLYIKHVAPRIEVDADGGKLFRKQFDRW